MTQTINPPTAQATSPAGTRRRQVIASLLGERSFEMIDWRRLLQDGVLIRLHIRRCRFTSRLSLEDIGVRVEDNAVRDKLSKWLILGEKRLLPEAYMKALSRIESSARHALFIRAFRTELGTFVPSTAYSAWREETMRLRDEYFALRDQIIANHRDLVRQVLGEYEVIAADTYQRLRGSHPELVFEGQQQFVSNYCNRIASQIPSPARIRETFDFKFILLDALSQLETVFSETRAAHAPADQHEMHSDMMDTVRSQTQERERQRALLVSDLRAHALERLNAALDSCLSAFVGSTRSLMYDVMYDVLTTLQRRPGESLAPQSVKQLINLLARVRPLNFYGDPEVERMLDQVEQIVQQSPAERQRNVADIERIGRAILTVTRSTLLDLGEEPRSARELAIPDIPTEAFVRQSRAELGLDLDASQFANLLQVRTEVRAERAEMMGNGMAPLWNFASNERQRQERPA